MYQKSIQENCYWLQSNQWRRINKKSPNYSTIRDKIQCKAKQTYQKHGMFWNSNQFYWLELTYREDQSISVSPANQAKTWKYQRSIGYSTKMSPKQQVANCSIITTLKVVENNIAMGVSHYFRYLCDCWGQSCPQIYQQQSQQSQTNYWNHHCNTWIHLLLCSLHCQNRWECCMKQGGDAQGCV